MEDAGVHEKPTRAAKRTRLGIDLGGTKIEVIALDSRGVELLRRRVATPQGDYQATVRACADLVHGLAPELAGDISVGVGIPGTLSRATGLVKNANSVWLNGRPLVQDLTSAIGRPIRLQNDANCFAVSEATDGAAAGSGIVFGVILGTGVGGGVVINGQLVDGPMGVTGEWGHNPLPAPDIGECPGPRCYCGRQGCIETFLSGPGMAARFADDGGTGGESAAAIVERARTGDTRAAAYLERYADRLARGLASVINILDPDVVVLGGGLSKLDFLYDRVPALLPRYVFSDRVDTRLVPPKHGDSSGVRGAAWLWPPTEAVAASP